MEKAAPAGRNPALRAVGLERRAALMIRTIAAHDKDYFLTLSSQLVASPREDVRVVGTAAAPRDGARTTLSVGILPGVRLRWVAEHRDVRPGGTA